MINLIENLYRRTQSAIRVGNDITEWFKQVIGVRQGCILSPDLFNIYLEHIMREALDGLEDIGVRITAEQSTTYASPTTLASWLNLLPKLNSSWTKLIKSARSMDKR
jgi:hypothetical protein